MPRAGHDCPQVHLGSACVVGCALLPVCGRPRRDTVAACLASHMQPELIYSLCVTAIRVQIIVELIAACLSPDARQRPSAEKALQVLLLTDGW